MIEIVKRNQLYKFAVLPRRWIAERTLAWIQPQSSPGARDRTVCALGGSLPPRHDPPHAAAPDQNRISQPELSSVLGSEILGSALTTRRSNKQKGRGERAICTKSIGVECLRW
jgi:hypothetical protein